MHDSGEVGREQITVELVDVVNQTALDTTTTTNGGYPFNKLSRGDYLVRAALPAGSAAVNAELLAVTVSGGETQVADFPLVELPSSVTGMVFNDLNRDGVLDDGEPGLSGVTVFIDHNGNGERDLAEFSFSAPAQRKRQLSTSDHNHQHDSAALLRFKRRRNCFAAGLTCRHKLPEWLICGRRRSECRRRGEKPKFASRRRAGTSTTFLAPRVLRCK